MKKISLLLCGMLLTACSTTVSTNIEDAASSSSSAAVSSAPQSSSTSSQPPVLLSDALDQTFSSPTLGIALRYPSSILVGECEPIPVTARETEYSVQFVVDHMPDETCGYLQSEVAAEIHVQHATELADMRAFVDRVFSPDCDIAVEEEGDAYQVNGDQYTHVFLHSKNPPVDEPDFACGEAITWNRTAGVVLFSSLGSKAGGGIDWPSSTEILLPDGNIEYAFDYLIMQSIEFLKP